MAEHSPVCPCSSSLSESGKTLLRLPLLLMFVRECQNTPRAFPARHVCPRVAEHSSVYPCLSRLSKSGRTLRLLAHRVCLKVAKHSSDSCSSCLFEWQNTPLAFLAHRVCQNTPQAFLAGHVCSRRRCGACSDASGDRTQY